MSRKAVIPSANAALSPGTDTMDVLEKRMAAAEKETQDLVEHLTNMGFSHDQKNGVTGDTISPFKPRVCVDEEVLHKNYETVVSRVCRCESALQTLKLNMMRMQAERDLSRQEKLVVKEKLSMAADAYDAEIKKLEKEITVLRKECKSAWDAKKEGEEHVKRLEITLEEAQNANSTVTAQLEDMELQKQKLIRRMNETREDLNREISMRSSLEESHKSLLQRIQDMESIVENERGEVKSLSSNCVALKHDTAKANEQAEMERNLRLQIQEQTQRTHIGESEYQQRVKELEQERNTLVQEVGNIRRQYNELNGQLDIMKGMIEENKASSQHLEKEKNALESAMKSTANTNAGLISKYESQLEAGRTELAFRKQDGEMVKELQDKLKTESQEKAHYEQKCTQLQLELKEFSSKLSGQEKQLSTASKQQDKDTSHWKKQLRLLQEEKERVLNDKDALLDEVNQAVDSMSEEKSRLESQIEECKLEVRGLENDKAALENENRRLLERINELEDSKASQKQIEQSIQEMLEQKNKLAYDKGKLQTRVDQLQREVEGLADAKNDLTQTKKVNAALDAKLNKTQLELQDAKLTIQRLESQVQHGHKTTDRKEKDFELAIKSRDEALKESHRLIAHIEALETRDKQKAHNTQLNLEDVRSDNKQLSGTLESVMQSHSRLQQTMESLQVELGKKDTFIADMNKEKIDLQHRAYQLQKENESLHNDILALKTYEEKEIKPVRQQLLFCKDDNTKMASSMETLLKSNSQLQGTLEALQDEIEKKTHLYAELQSAREQEHDNHKREVRNYEERIENFKQQLTKERDKSLKKTNKEVNEVRKQLDDILNKNGELSRANGELRHKITEIEYQMKDQREKISRQKHNIEHLTKIRQKQDEAIKVLEGVSEQIRELEKSKAYYVKKNKEQAQTIQAFMAQISGLQEEITSLAQAQVDTTVLLQEQEDQLMNERKTIEEWKRKYRETKKREVELDGFRKHTSEKLQEAENESMMISSNLDDAQSWFKSKLDTLQHELLRSKKSQVQREKENDEVKKLLENEKRRAEETARRAQAMIKASRETINRVANHAEVENKTTNHEMYLLKQQLEAERENSFNAQEKLRTFQESSLRHAEQLARELNFLKSQSLVYDST